MTAVSTMMSTSQAFETGPMHAANLHSEEGMSMTRTSRIPLHRQLIVTSLAIMVAASALPVQAQYRHGYGRPVPHRPYRPYRPEPRRGGDGGALIAGALLGVVAGAVIANSAASAAAPPPGAVIYTQAPPPPPPGVVYYDNGYGYPPPPPPPPPGY
jgi:hypothetical protein